MAETTTSEKLCRCGSDAIEPEIVQPGQPGHGTHYARLVCCDCGKFNGWAPDPKVTAAFEKRQGRIVDLLAKADLSAWERDFLVSVLPRRHLTDKQIGVWERIATKYTHVTL